MSRRRLRPGSSVRPTRPRVILRVIEWLVCVPAALLVVCGIALGVLWLWALSSSHAANSGEVDRGLAGFERQAPLTQIWPEPWRAHYNAGTAHLMKDDLEPGVNELTLALDRVPPGESIGDGALDSDSDECRVRINLSIGVERQGDALAEAGDEAGAKAAWAKAAEYSKPCAQNSSNSDQSQQGEAANERQQDKADPSSKSGDRSDQAPREGSSSSSGDGSPDSTPSQGTDKNGNGQDPQSNPQNPSTDGGEGGQESPQEREERERQQQLEQRNRDHDERTGGRPDATPPGRYW